MAELSVNGRAISVPDGSMVSTAIAASGCDAFRRSIAGEPRGPLCGMGICFECRVTIDGEAHGRSCQIPATSGMDVHTDEAKQILKESEPPSLAHRDCDVLIIGAGPAGLSAAWAASQSGSRVLVVDDNPTQGGQIWRGESKSKTSPEAQLWFERIAAAKLEVINGARVFDAPKTGKVRAETATGVTEIEYRSLILATGARERFLPFPGWSLPNVVGAGGLQALVKGGLPIKGKRVVVAGSGPLLLAVALYLRTQGADILLIAEQATRAKLASFGIGLLSAPSKAAQALGLLRGLRGIPIRPGSWVTAAEGERKLARAVIRDGSTVRSLECDYLAVGYHLVPNLEFAALLGCELKGDGIVVDDLQKTSIDTVYSAGESTGIGGLDLSLAEGQIAGYAATGQLERARRLLSERKTARKFATRLSSTFALRDELKLLPRDETIICRCEDVRWRQIVDHSSWRSAKLHTRCGMGPCQGRVCGGALSFLLDWPVESVRPPVFPVRIESMAETQT